ncbi:MAG: hypothetical protein RIR49_1471 [Actinomycetota bacterium]
MRYRMAPEELVFWMGPIEGEVDARYGVLCRRHADGMTVPRGWTLDDSRDPTLRLFRPTVDDGQRTRRSPASRTGSPATADGEQLELDASVPPGAEVAESESADPVDGLDRAPISPLLARAFRGTPLER